MFVKVDATVAENQIKNHVRKNEINKYVVKRWINDDEYVIQW